MWAGSESSDSSPIAPNTLDRQLHADVPNKAWVTDVTYVWTLKGWVYLAAILDLCSRRVVGWAAGATNDRELALTALSNAWGARRPGPGLLHHSDRGSTYASADYRAALERRQARASMSRLVGQRCGRVLLRDYQGRAHRPRALHHARGCHHVDCRLHR